MNHSLLFISIVFGRCNCVVLTTWWHSYYGFIEILSPKNFLIFVDAFGFPTIKICAVRLRCTWANDRYRIVNAIKIEIHPSMHTSNLMSSNRAITSQSISINRKQPTAGNDCVLLISSTLDSKISYCAFHNCIKSTDITVYNKQKLLINGKSNRANWFK